MTSRWHYTAVISFDPSHTEQQRRGWLVALRERMLFMVEVEEALADDEIVELDGSAGSVMIEFWPDQTPRIRRARLTHLADAIESVRRNRVQPLPDELPLKYRMAS